MDNNIKTMGNNTNKKDRFFIALLIISSTIVITANIIVNFL